MRRNVRLDIMAMIVRKSVAATIIHRAMHRAAFVSATKAGLVAIVQNHAPKVSMVWDARRNVQL